MNCYSIIVFCCVSLFAFQDKHFVDFKDDEVKISSKGEYLTVVLTFEILENFHIQSEKIEDNNFIPTEIHFDDPDGFKIASYQLSKVNREIIMLDKLKCEVLSNDLEFTIRLIRKISTNENINLKGYLYYQACDDRQCFYPRNLPFNVKLTH
jgi:hypothetical protein